MRHLKKIIRKVLIDLKIIKPSIIIMVDGGFCSTIVKYAIGRLLEIKTGAKVKYDLSWFELDGFDCDGKHRRNFDLLKVFPKLKFEVASKEDVKTYKKFFCYENKLTYEYNEELFNLKPPVYLDGYFANWKYFNSIREELLSELKFENLDLNFQNQKYLKNITSDKNSVAVHVRRGDYVAAGLCILTPEYYLASINHIINSSKGEKPHFYFFSNGMDWVKDEIVKKLDSNISYTLVESNDNDAGYIDLFLISKCKHQISSNSSFGFWGGFLNENKDKIVIIPETWTNSITINSKGADLAHRMPEWVCLPCDGGFVNE